MKNKKIYWILIGLVFFVLVLEKNFFLNEIGNFLIVKSALKPADAIVVLAGDEYERVKYAVTLYQKGMAKYIIMSGKITEGDSVSEAESMKDEAVQMGAPAKNIILETKSGHTYEHPLFIKPILIERNFKTVIIVSSPYHMRRVSILFDREFHTTPIKLIYSPVEHSWFHAERWWKNKTARRIVLSEYLKMTVNVLGSKIDGYLYKFFEIE